MKSETAIVRELTEYGFQFGAAKVERCMEVGKGAIVVTVTTPKARLDVYVTRTGKVRVFSQNVEWLRKESNRG